MTVGIGDMIGEIMEDHAPVALSRIDSTPGWVDRLEQAGEDIATLARAAAIIARRAEDEIV